jgi:hypothetical protein
MLKRRQLIAAARGLPLPQLFCSYVQVYGNEVTDLLEGGGQHAIGVWGGVAAAAIAQGAAEVAVTDAAHMQQLLFTAESNKRRAATAMNERSSRSHSILTLRMTHPLCTPLRPPSRLVIADLGGCERVMQASCSAHLHIVWQRYFSPPIERNSSYTLH